MAPPQKIAVITGAGSGIGRATRLRCSRTGFPSCSPAAAAKCWRRPPRSPRRRRRACWWCRPTSPTRPRSPRCSTRSRRPMAASTCCSTTPGISTRNIPIEDLTYEQWSNVVAVNLTGSFLCAQHAFRMMKSQDPRGGRIINNGSVSAHVPRRNSTPYVATKHALTGLTRSLSLDGRRIQHRLRPDRHRQRRDDAQRRHRARPPAGHRQGRGRGAHRRERRRARRRLYGQPVARGERPVHDRDGDEDALYRPRLMPTKTIIRRWIT